MPLPHVNKIGGTGSDDFAFVDLKGPISDEKERVEIFEWRGVNSVGLRKTGSRGIPFTLISTQFYDDFAGAKAAYSTQKAVIGGSARELVRNSESWGNVFVLDVIEHVPMTATGIATVTDIYVATSAVLYIARWTLVFQ